ncbi:hypothetical protein STENM36S_02054 [Streptomyces tendae]
MFERIGEITRLRQKLVGYVEAPPATESAPAAAAKGKGVKSKRKRGA